MEWDGLKKCFRFLVEVTGGRVSLLTCHCSLRLASARALINLKRLVGDGVPAEQPFGTGTQSDTDLLTQRKGDVRERRAAILHYEQSSWDKNNRQWSR